MRISLCSCTSQIACVLCSDAEQENAVLAKKVKAAEADLKSREATVQNIGNAIVKMQDFEAKEEMCRSYYEARLVS